MFFVYAPEDGERQEWWFDPGKVRTQEAEAIEKRTGWDWSEFGLHLIKGSALARRALLWTYQRRVHHTLRFEDVDFALGEVSIEYSKDELARMRDEAAAQTDVSMAEKSAVVAQLEREMVEAKEAPGKAGASSGG